MKNFRKAIALFLSMLMILAVAPVSVFAEEAEIVPDADLNEDIDTATETLNPFALIGKFFEMIGETLRIVVEFLQNMFTGSGNDALDQIK